VGPFAGAFRPVAVHVDAHTAEQLPAQIDATSIFLLALAQMTSSGITVIFTLDEVEVRNPPLCDDDHDDDHDDYHEDHEDDDVRARD
jgi:hypothetical protein